MDPDKLKKLEAMGEAVPLHMERRLFRGLLYGDYGAGKTTLAGQIAKVLGGDICLINTDSAWSVLTRDEELASRIVRYPFDSFAQIRLILEARAEGIKPFCNFKTLIWDTATTSIDRVLRDLVGKVAVTTKAVGIDPKSEAFINRDAALKLEAYPHYRMTSNKLKETVDALAESDLHIIYTGHLRIPNEADKDKKLFAIRSNAPEASYAVIAKEVNLIGWLFKDAAGRQRMIQTEGTVTEAAKSQIPTIPETKMEASKIPELVLKWVQG